MSKVAKFCLAQGLTSLAAYPDPNFPQVLPPTSPRSEGYKSPHSRRVTGKEGALPYV